MAEYIERDSAINAVYESFADGKSPYGALISIPAADVRPVVLCRDCKHSAVDLENMRYCKCVTYYNHISDDWFCSDGEKREES